MSLWLGSKMGESATAAQTAKEAAAREAAARELEKQKKIKRPSTWNMLEQSLKRSTGD